MSDISRRRLLTTAGAAGLLVATGGWPGRGRGFARPAPASAVDFAPDGLGLPLPDPAASGIDHVVLVVMENRSFDHFLGWLPGANGAQDTTTARYPDAAGRLHPNHHLADPRGCGEPDPDHSYHGGRFQLHGGAMDNFARRDDFRSLGFYKEGDRPFMSALARHYTTCDSYFCSFLGSTWPNRFFVHAAQNQDAGRGEVTVPTIWDRLNRPGGPTGRYYYSDAPFLGMWGGRYRAISEPYHQFTAAARAGTLPNVAFVDPSFVGSGAGRGNDDHPRAHIGAGDAFLAEVFHTLARSPAWDRTVLVITYDEWGGFYDHVVPPRVTPGVPIGAGPASGPDKDVVDGRVLLGFRVPCIVASPLSRGADPARPRVDHRLYDHTSILKLIEWRWRLRPLGQRDASNRRADPGNLAAVLHFGRSDPSVPGAIPYPQPPPPGACRTNGSGGAFEADDTWTPVLEAAARAGFELPA
ncbi:MAG TPA: alkaline phosphatase family protein [Acidimicrobiia bacterium]|nr:alkaline phosphatase family protein [Acidimicrobiia bacterium]